MPYHKPEDNSWSEYRRLVMDFCEKTAARLDDIENGIEKINLDIATIKLKIAMVSGVCGFIGSLIPVIIHYVILKLI